MQIKASEIKIDASDRCNLIITDKALCMDESRFVLVDFYPACKKRCIVRLRQKKNCLFIRNSRRHNAHIHAAFRRIAQAGEHFIVHDKIRSKNIHVIFRFIDDIHVYIFSHRLMV